MAYANAAWFTPSADYRLTCPCVSCCVATGREPSVAQVQDRRESERLIARMGWTDLLATTSQ